MITLTYDAQEIAKHFAARVLSTCERSDLPRNQLALESLVREEIEDDDRYCEITRDIPRTPRAVIAEAAEMAAEIILKEVAHD